MHGSISVDGMTTCDVRRASRVCDWLTATARANSLFARLISHQPAVLFSQNESATSNQPQPASSILLSEQTSISHQPPANRTGCKAEVKRYC
jgi:hypothetical protein